MLMAELSILQAPAIWQEMLTVNRGESLATLAEKQPVLLIFLRFFGCSFCREAIGDIAKQRKKLEASGLRIVFVHMSPDAVTAEKFFRKYRLFPIDHIADPEKIYYQAFGLSRSTPTQLLSLMNWIRGFQAVVLEGHGASHPTEELGDGFQMPGVFVLHKGQVKASYVHQHPYDRPDYAEICAI